MVEVFKKRGMAPKTTIKYECKDKKLKNYVDSIYRLCEWCGEGIGGECAGYDGKGGCELKWIFIKHKFKIKPEGKCLDNIRGGDKI